MLFSYIFLSNKFMHFMDVVFFLTSVREDVGMIIDSVVIQDDIFYDIVKYMLNKTLAW